MNNLVKCLNISIIHVLSVIFLVDIVYIQHSFIYIKLVYGSDLSLYYSLIMLLLSKHTDHFISCWNDHFTPSWNDYFAPSETFYEL